MHNQWTMGPKQKRAYDLRCRKSFFMEAFAGSMGNPYHYALAESVRGLFKPKLAHAGAPWMNDEHVE